MTEGTNYIQVHPTFLYEGMWNLMLLIFLLVYLKHKKFDGEIALLYFAGYGIGRALIESIRTDQLYPGMNGTACFPRKEGPTVPTVPLAALVEDGTRTLVYTAYTEETDELLSPVEVQTGVSDGTDVEILSGLSVGDTFYYRYADEVSYVTE